MLNSNVGYVEDDDAISIHDSRLTVTKKVYRKYTNGKREVYIAGTLAKALASDSETIANITDTPLNECAFVAKVGGNAYLGFAMINSNALKVNIKHTGSFSSGIDVSIYCVFFV